MRNRCAWVVAALVASAGCKAVSEGVKRQRERLVEEAGRPTPTLPPPPAPTGPLGVAPGRYRLTEVAVAVSARGPGGLPWDLGSGAAPDLRVIVRVDGTQVAVCDGPDDALLARCPLDVAVALVAGSRIWIDVRDRDGGGDEEIGSARLADLGHTGRVDAAMVLETVGGVAEAQLAMIAAPPRPSVWAGPWRRAAGAGVGALVALAVLFGFRRSLVRTALTPVRIATWTCRGCGATAPTTATTCPRCGGAR